ncbi:MAG: tRNA (cytidine(34)-2'-O)-methyltransferase [Vicinamibacteria bacterium]|jgi:tRNA (cytidine/uridine-2'-O-)-methyltransferase|nr:tRNA (cytidine(34)-2'-O)-methyltransferase [Vicinamibacteria bacterium]
MSRSLHVVLVEPEIHWNTGNAGRTCLAVGAQLHLIEPLGFRLDEKQVRRAGLDYWPRVAPRIWPDWDAFERELPRLGQPYLFCPRVPREVWSVEYVEPAVLIFGCESVGLATGIKERYAEQLVSIPIHDPTVRSLNLSTSVAVAAFEVRRQWRLRCTSRSSPWP